MSGFADLPAMSMPVIVTQGARGSGVEGRTWSWTISGFKDAAGAVIDLSSGVTGSCTIWEKTSGNAVISPTVTGNSNGSVTIAATKAATANLAAGQHPRPCKWALSLDNGTVAVQVWGPDNSFFAIHAAS